MKQLMRLLIMFGPLIFRQIQKFQRNKQRKQGYATPDPLPRGKRRARKEEYIPSEEIKKEPLLTEEERNFKLDDEDIMLDEEDLVYTKEDSSKNDDDIYNEYEDDLNNDS